MVGFYTDCLLIDNIFLNSIEHFVISGNVVYDLTDHLPNFVIFEKFSFLPSNVNMYRRDYSKLNELLDLIDDFQHVNWQTVLHVSTCNDPYLKDIGNRFFYWLFLFTLVILIRICILFGMKIIYLIMHIARHFESTFWKIIFHVI